LDQANQAEHRCIIVIETEKFVADTYINGPLASYAAFCRKYGNHTPKGLEHRCWNDEAIAGMVSSMELPWERLLESYESAKDENLRDVEDLFQRAETMGKTNILYLAARSLTFSLVAATRIPADIRRLLLNTLPNHEDQLMSDLTQLYDELERNLG
jgi:hypothetical protein